jgi:hypothetical protein
MLGAAATAERALRVLVLLRQLRDQGLSEPTGSRG